MMPTGHEIIPESLVAPANCQELHGGSIENETLTEVESMKRRYSTPFFQKKGVGVA